MSNCKDKFENRVITYILLILALCLVSINYNYANSKISNILLLNSYHDGYEWSNNIKKGVKDVLDNSDFEYKMRVEHMDTKNNSSDKYLEELYFLYKTKFENEDFDVIICADDNALKFLLKYGKELFGDTPIFFSGVNTLSTHDLSGVDNIYGVVEKHSIAQTTEMALKLNPKINNVYLVLDDSITGNASKVDALNDMEKYEHILNFKILDNMSYEEILTFTETLDPADSIVIQAFYVVDTDGQTYPLEYTAKQLIERSNAPIFAIFSFGFGEGVVGGKFVEGYTQGARVANMVVEYIVMGSYDKERFIVDDSVNRSYFDYSVIKELGYDIKNVPSDSIIINKPVNFYKRNAKIINISLVIFALLLLYVYILRRQVNIQSSRIVTTQKQLIDSEKMAALGRLVAGVSHEINTPVGIGVTLSSYIHKETETIIESYETKKLCETKLKEYLADMKNSSEMMISTMNRATILIQSFKQVAVDQSIDEKRNIELGNYIGEIVNSLNSELKKKSIKIEIFSKEEVKMYAYTGAIYQIFSNLIMNSLKHGFGKRETGEIDISIVKSSVNSINNEPSKVQINYRDNGNGISEHNISKIYDPFYTTKINDGGSGLGLNIVYNLVIDRLGGSIKCTSEVGKFTQFEISFPIDSEILLNSD